MNLIKDPWIPVSRESGKNELIAPWQITETSDRIIAINAVRPDFNGSLMQFLIGLLQTAAAPEDEYKWASWMETPPSPEILRDYFSRYTKAFEVHGEKGSFMQDIEDFDSESKPIERLLIESPKKNTVAKNIDHFIKSGLIKTLCPNCVVTALFTLQINAPAGGVGYRVSLRGGGPLTTLVVSDPETGELCDDLWTNLWLNVLEPNKIPCDEGSSEQNARSDIFPWLAKTRTSEKNTGRNTTPMDVNPLQMYWGMPLRIRILWDNVTCGYCDLCGTYSEKLISHYKTCNYGINYEGTWQHPLNPYYLKKGRKGESDQWLPRHPQQGGFTYKNWLSVAFDSETELSAIVVKHRCGLLDKLGLQLRIYAFGYDMENDKARCWYETTYPLYKVSEDIRSDFSKRVQSLTETAAEFAKIVQDSVKQAWFGKNAGNKTPSFLTELFYQRTESDFWFVVRELRENTGIEILHKWHKILCKSSVEIFDYWAARGDFAQADPRRIADARREMLKKKFYNKRIKDILQLPKEIKSTK